MLWLSPLPERKVAYTVLNKGSARNSRNWSSRLLVLRGVPSPSLTRDRT